MRFVRFCKSAGFVGSGMLLAAMLEYGAHPWIVWGFISSLTIIALSTFIQGTIKEDHYESNYIQLP